MPASPIAARTPSLLERIRADFAARGWNPADLAGFRMEELPAPPAPPAPTPPAPPAPDLGALQQAIDAAKASGETTATTSLLTALGFDKLEDAQAWVTAKRDAERAGMDEATRLKAEAEEARKKADADAAKAAETETKAARTQFNADLRIFLQECGVPVAGLADVAVLVSAELGGAIDAKPEAVVEATAKVRTRQPALFGTAGAPTPTPGRAPGGLPTGQPPAPAPGVDPLAAGREKAKQARASRQTSTREDLIRQFSPQPSPLAPTN